MSRIELSSRGGRTRVVITADKGSTIKNIVVGGRPVSEQDLVEWDVQEKRWPQVLDVLLPWIIGCVAGFIIVSVLSLLAR